MTPALRGLTVAGREHCPDPRGSQAALGHVSEELLALLVTEAPQAVGALQVPLASAGCSGVPALYRGGHTQGPSCRLLATERQKLHSIGL